MAQSDLQKAIESLVSVAGEISGKMDSIQQLLEEQQDGQTSRSGNAPQSAPAQAQGSQAGGVVAAAGESPSQRQASATRSAALGIGLDTLVGVSDPTQSKVVAAAEGARQLLKFKATVLAEKIGGESAREFVGAGVDAGLNALGYGQQIAAINNAKSSLGSRLVGAADAGIIFSDKQIEEMAASEIGRQDVRMEQLNRARAAIDATLVKMGRDSISGTSEKEQTELLAKIEKNTRNAVGDKSLKGGNQ